MNNSNNNRYSGKKNHNNYYKKNKKKNNENSNSSGSDISNISNKLKNSNKHHRYHTSQIRRGNKRKSFEKDPIEKLFNRREYLLDQYLKARYKYFEFFYTRDSRLKQKHERSYVNCLKQLNEFNKNLTVEQNKKLDKRSNVFDFDTTYSNDHSLDGAGEKTPADYQINDPHVLETQKDLDYSRDTEESIGKIEDCAKT